MKHLPTWVLLGCIAVSGLAPAQAPEHPPTAVDLPAGSLMQALDRLSQQTGLQILYDPSVVEGRFANQLQGSLTPIQALEQLLAPTDVSYQVTGTDSVALLATPRALPEVRVESTEPRFVSPTRLDHIGRIWAPVTINGKGPFRLVLDTGASQSALIASTARQLGIAAVTQPARLYGVTGTAVVPAVQVDTLEVGNVAIGARSLPIVADVFGGAEGVLGREGLQDKRILADFQHDRLVISLSHKERAPIGFRVVSLKLTNMGLLAAEARVGGIATTAIIDTGSQATIGNNALREALTLRRQTPIPETRVMGVTLDVQHGDTLPAPPIRLGELQVNRARVTFGDMSLFEHWKLTQKPTILIGMDVLGVVDVLIIDYKLRELQVLMHDRFPRPLLD